VILENHDNDAGLLRHGCTAQWNDDAHHVLHVLLTGERFGYYAAYADAATAGLARWLADGFVFQGERVPGTGIERGSPSADLPPSAFINCLQNHDQVGNRAFGDRLNGRVDKGRLLAAYTLLLLIPQIPLLFMGEDRGATTPFHYFTDFGEELAGAVREGRRREFAHADGIDENALSDPNAQSSFDDSRPAMEAGDALLRRQLEHLIELRHRHIVPRLRDARSVGATVVAEGAVDARWRMGDGSILRIVINLGSVEVVVDDASSPLLYSSAALTPGVLPAGCCTVWLAAA
jgi:maltooligosyltrehalose trehalohydrolase